MVWLHVLENMCMFLLIELKCKTLNIWTHGLLCVPDLCCHQCSMCTRNSIPHLQAFSCCIPSWNRKLIEVIIAKAKV